MDRRHLIIPAALLAGSALLGGRAIIQTMGPDAAPSQQASSSTLTTSTGDAAVADRATQLDAMEQRIAALAADTPPAVTPAPAPQTIAVHAGRGPSANAGSGSPGNQPQSARGGDDDGPEHESAEHAGGDDDGAEHESAEHAGGDDHGGDDGGSDDDGSGHGGDDD